MTAAIVDKSAPAAPASATAPVRSLSHLTYVDALRVVLIMLVVAHHSVEAYVKLIFYSWCLNVLSNPLICLEVGVPRRDIVVPRCALIIIDLFEGVSGYCAHHD